MFAVVVISTVLGFAVVGKLAQPQVFTSYLSEVLPRWVPVRLTAVLVIAAEATCVAIAFVNPKLSLLVATSLLVAFTFFHIRSLVDRTLPTCICFGQRSNKTSPAIGLARNCALIVIAVIGLQSNMLFESSGDIFAVVAAGVVVGSLIANFESFTPMFTHNESS